MPYIRLASFCIGGGFAVASHPLESCIDLVQRGLPSGRQIKNTSIHVVGRGMNGQQVRPDDIFDIGKIPRLLAVTEDRRALLTEHLLNKARQHAGVRRTRILVGAEHIEVAEANGLHSKKPAEYL